MRANTRLLITGVSGLLGSNLARFFKTKYEILGLYNEHKIKLGDIKLANCNLLNTGNIKNVMREFSPGIIVHCAAMTNIDECERNQGLARHVNVTVTKDIVDSIGQNDTYLIYISTDSVYEGSKGDYAEDDEINPKNFYGLSKYEGELEVNKHQNSLILRTNFFGWNVQNKKSLAEWILNELKANRKINGFKDAYFFFHV